ncbi:MAG TPA: hypothetical protein VGX78_10105, partial [Pirellulales bacterium]|nr:hypothetical protein [Pirellulales bacterium]
KILLSQSRKMTDRGTDLGDPQPLKYYPLTNQEKGGTSPPEAGAGPPKKGPETLVPTLGV